MTKTIQNKSITTIIAITATIALLGLSSVFITNQEALAEAHPREIPDRGYEGIGGSISCVLNRNIPADPLRVNIMDTVAGFHTVIMEKEIFDCIVTAAAGQIMFPVILQDTLLIQFDENKKGKPKATGIKIEVISCEKDLQRIALFGPFGPNCINFGTPTEAISLLDCRGDEGTTEAFVEMDSASFDWLHKFAKNKVTYKTVIVEKEILDCVIAGTSTPRIAEVFTIEEIVNGKVQPLKWVVCEKDPDIIILGCITSDTPLLGNAE